MSFNTCKIKNRAQSHNNLLQTTTLSYIQWITDDSVVPFRRHPKTYFRQRSTIESRNNRSANFIQANHYCHVFSITVDSIAFTFSEPFISFILIQLGEIVRYVKFFDHLPLSSSTFFPSLAIVIIRTAMDHYSIQL